MAQDSPPKHAKSLGERLEKKLEADLSEVVSLTQNKLDDLAENSIKQFRGSLNTEMNAIESRIRSLRKFTKWTLGVTVLASILLAVLVVAGLYFYGNMKLHRIEKEHQSIEAQMKKLPPPFRVKKIQGKWYLEAPRINYTPMTYTRSNGEKGDAVQLIP